MVRIAFWGVESWREFHTIKLGFALQRLFSTFPNSWPGFGLLLLRLSVGIALIYLGIIRLFGTLGEPITVARAFIEAAGGIFLLAGFWTPVMGALITLDEVWIAFSLNSSEPDRRLIHIFLAVLAAGVAMLGPWGLVHRRSPLRKKALQDGPAQSWYEAPPLEGDQTCNDPGT
jgi:putative oxidoreductase